MAKGRERKALPQDRGGLKRPSVQRIQQVDARLDKRLHRARHARLRIFLRMAQELLEEERIASGAIHQPLGERLVGKGGRARQRHRVLAAQRSQIDGDQRGAVGLAAPARVDEVSLRARRHHEDGGHSPMAPANVAR